jgi:GNAT superfamily N-acetyltransferase
MFGNKLEESCVADSLLIRTLSRVRYYRAGLPWYGLLVRLMIECLATLGLRIDPFHLFIETMGGKQPPVESGFDNFVIDYLEAGDMAALARIPGRNFSEDELLLRLEQGKRCLGIRYRGEIVAFIWFNLNECTFESHTLFILRENEAHLFDTYTAESFRGKSLAPHLRYRCYEELAKLGRERLYSVTVLFNTPAVRYKQKLGAQIAELMVFVELLKRCRFHARLKRYAPSRAVESET